MEAVGGVGGLGAIGGVAVGGRRTPSRPRGGVVGRPSAGEPPGSDVAAGAGTTGLMSLTSFTSFTSFTSGRRAAATGAVTGAATSTAPPAGWRATSRTQGVSRSCAAAGATGWRLVITAAGTTVTAFGNLRLVNSRGACGLLMTVVIWVMFVTFVMLMFCA